MVFTIMGGCLELRCSCLHVVSCCLFFGAGCFCMVEALSLLINYLFIEINYEITFVVRAATNYDSYSFSKSLHYLCLKNGMKC